MTRSTKSGLILSAAIAILPTLGWVSTARAQFQVGSGGHATDASNRVGGGGINSGNSGSTNGFNNNTNIFTGNVSGLNYFHGNTNGIFDPNTVQASTGTSASDRLNTISAPTSGSFQSGGGNGQAYYNSSRISNTPSNFVPTQNGTGYVPAPPLQPLTPDSDSRLGAVNLNNSQQNLLPAPGEVDMAGQVDPTSGSQSLYTMSPIYGVRKNDTTSDSFFLSQYSNYGQTNAGARSKLDSTAVQRMQDELNSNALPNDSLSPAKPGDNSGNTASPGALNDQLQSSALSTSQLSGQSLTSQFGTAQIDNSGLSNGQSSQNRRIIPAAQQSAQIQALEKKYSGQKLTDAQSADLFNQQQRLLKEAVQKPGTNGTGMKPAAPNLAGSKSPIPGGVFSGTGNSNSTGAGGVTGTGTPALPTPGTPATGTPATPKPEEKLSPVLNGNNSAADNQPFVITSLAAGIKAKGLADLLKSAEDQMHAGKFSQAIDTYDTAQQVAPNNPFVPLGRGFAELGRSYYAKADADITRAVTAEPAILAGQYDLKDFIGDERLRFVQKDLADIAGTEKTARSPVLLAYIAHNVGDDTTAARELDEATKRGGYTAMVNLMRQTWGFPAAK